MMMVRLLHPAALSSMWGIVLQWHLHSYAVALAVLPIDTGAWARPRRSHGAGAGSDEACGASAGRGNGMYIQARGVVWRGSAVLGAAEKVRASKLWVGFRGTNSGWVCGEQVPAKGGGTAGGVGEKSIRGTLLCSQQLPLAVHGAGPPLHAGAPLHEAASHRV